MSATGVSVIVMTSSPSPQAGPPAGVLTNRATVTVPLVVLLASFMDLLDATIVVVAGPAIAGDLGASSAQLQWVIAGYVLALGAGLITGGRIGDQYGRRLVFLWSLAAFGLTSAACAVAVDPEMLIATRVAQGLAAGLMVPQVFGIIRSSFDPAGMAKAFGAYGAVQGLAAVAGPLLGGLLVDADLFGVGWRAIFWVNVPIAGVALLLGTRVLPESKDQRSGTLDLVGAAMSALAVLLLLLPLVQGREWGWPWWGFALMAAGVLILGGFVRYEALLTWRGGRPILDPALFRVRNFVAGLSVSLVFFGAIGAFFLTLSLYLQLGAGRSAWETGLVILPYAIGSIITSGLGVAFASRMGRSMLLAGALALAVSQLLVWLMVRGGQDPGYWPLALALFVGGLGLGLTAPILVNVILAGVPVQDAGAAGGVLSTVNQVGGAAGIAVLGTVFFTVLDNTNGDPAGQSTALHSFSEAFASVLPIGVALYVLAALLMLLLPRTAASSGHS